MTKRRRIKESSRRSKSMVRKLLSCLIPHGGKMNLLGSAIARWLAITLLLVSGAAFADPGRVLYMGPEGTFNDLPFAGGPVGVTTIRSCGNTCRVASAAGTEMDLGVREIDAIQLPVREDDGLVPGPSDAVFEEVGRDVAIETFGIFASLATETPVEINAAIGIEAIPEPAGPLLLAIGALGFALVRRRR